ncbi:MAG: hypothetical protein ACRD00_01615 [Thermoanaerobaculia bacterium]
MRLLGLLALGPALAAPAQTPGPMIRNHFESDAVMRAPGFFDFAELSAPGPAEWIVFADQNPPSPPNQLTQTAANRPADSIAVAIRRNVSFRDGQLSVALRRASGRGGILLRMSSEKDFLVLLVDSASGDARLVSYRGGKASELSRGQAGFERDWGVLTIHASGEEVRAFWEGKPLFSGKDPMPSIGRTGLATAGPGHAAFDEFILQAASEKEK